jgi:hypothetical protein
MRSIGHKLSLPPLHSGEHKAVGESPLSHPHPLESRMIEDMTVEIASSKWDRYKELMFELTSTFDVDPTESYKLVERFERDDLEGLTPEQRSAFQDPEFKMYLRLSEVGHYSYSLPETMPIEGRKLCFFGSVHSGEPESIRSMTLALANTLLEFKPTLVLVELNNYFPGYSSVREACPEFAEDLDRILLEEKEKGNETFLGIVTARGNDLLKFMGEATISLLYAHMNDIPVHSPDSPSLVVDTVIEDSLSDPTLSRDQQYFFGRDMLCAVSLYTGTQADFEGYMDTEILKYSERRESRPIWGSFFDKATPPTFAEYRAKIQDIARLVERECDKPPSGKEHDLGDPENREYFASLVHGSSENSKNDEAINMPRRTALIVRAIVSGTEKGERAFATFGKIHALRQESAWRRHCL